MVGLYAALWLVFKKFGGKVYSDEDGGDSGFYEGGGGEGAARPWHHAERGNGASSFKQNAKNSEIIVRENISKKITDTIIFTFEESYLSTYVLISEILVKRA